MASDQIVTPPGKRTRPERHAGVTDPAAPAPRPGWRGPTTVAGWIVGLLTLLFAGATVVLADAYPPSLATGWALLLPGLLVLPPVVGLARRQSPLLGSLWAPPAIYVLLTLSAFALGVAIEPHGAARLPYINRALAAAETALTAHDPDGASAQMAMFRSDAASNPAVSAMLGRISAAKAAQDAAAGPPSPTHEATLAELKRVDDLFQARGLVCKQALGETSAALLADLPVAAYQAADTGVHACQTLVPTASLAVPEPARDKLNADIQACDTGYAQIWAGLRHVRGLVKQAPRIKIKKVIATNDDLGRGRDMVNACLPAYETDIAAAGLKRPAPDLVIGSIAQID
jgi:hypothetical protein